MKLKSKILKIALFATGLSGIVAEYVLATLATYILNDSVFQWTMILSVMMFSMGLGSWFSKNMKTNLLQKFIYIEFTLSILVAFSSIITYTVLGLTPYVGFVIYSLSVFIGVLIGMEIPLVIRLNDEFETLRVNVSSVIEMDYFGALAGGLFFAYFGLPYLGLTYTPFVLGIINFSVALILVGMLWKHLDKHLAKKLVIFASIIIIGMIVGIKISKSVVMFGEQKRYKDKVIFSEQTKYQKIVVTQWKDDYWLYLNGNQQLCTRDEVMYHEPIVHPAMGLLKKPTSALILGGGDGCAARELLKYKSLTNIQLVDLDPEMTKLSKTNPIFLEMNKQSFLNPRLKITNEDGYKFIEETKEYFDIIIIDLPDPRTVELSRLYSFEFYKLCKKQLRPHGVIITQAGSPYFATKAFLCIEKTIKTAGFQTVPIQNQIITLGQWGWIIGINDTLNIDYKKVLQNLTFDNIETKWLNHEAMSHITSFGKYYLLNPSDSIEINTIHNPVLQKYYLNGSWDLY